MATGDTARSEYQSSTRSTGLQRSVPGARREVTGEVNLSSATMRRQ